VEGCEAERFQPLNINGWFWSSTLKMMPPTNLVSNSTVVKKRFFEKTNMANQILIGFSTTTGLLVSLMGSLSLMVSEQRLVLPSLIMGRASGLMKSVEQEDTLFVKICQCLTLTLSEIKTPTLTSLKMENVKMTKT